MMTTNSSLNIISSLEFGDRSEKLRKKWRYLSELTLKSYRNLPTDDITKNLYHVPCNCILLKCTCILVMNFIGILVHFGDMSLSHRQFLEQNSNHYAIARVYEVIISSLLTGLFVLLHVEWISPWLSNSVYKHRYSSRKNTLYKLLKNAW